MTRRSGDLPKEGDERLLHQSQTMLKPHNLTVSALNISNNELIAPADQEPANQEPADDDQAPADVGNDIDIQNLVEEGYRQDMLPQKVLKALREGKTESKLLALRDCENRGGYLWYQKGLYIPDHEPLKLGLIQNHHDAPTAGHPGRAKTLELLTRSYYWPKMYRDVDRYLKNCHTCQRARTSRHAPYGILRPLPVPEKAWQDVSMDFVTGLPWSKGKNAILVVVC